METKCRCDGEARAREDGGRTEPAANAALWPQAGAPFSWVISIRGGPYATTAVSIALAAPLAFIAFGEMCKLL